MELNKLGRHRCLHSFDVMMEETERASFCIQNQREKEEEEEEEENEFSIISCAA